MASLSQILGSRRPRVSPLVTRSFEELIRDVQPGLRQGTQFALEQQQAQGVPLTQAFLASARAGAPEQTSLALSRLRDLEAGGLPAAEAREFEEAFRSRATAQLGTLGAQQPRQVFEEALERARLLRELQERNLGLLPTVGPADIFSRLSPTLDTALSVEQQRGANVQALLNARAQARNAARTAQFKGITTLLGASAGAIGGAFAPAAFGATSGGAGALMGGLSGANIMQGGGAVMQPQPAFQFQQQAQRPLTQQGVANQPAGPASLGGSTNFENFFQFRR